MEETEKKMQEEAVPAEPEKKKAVAPEPAPESYWLLRRIDWVKRPEDTRLPIMIMNLAGSADFRLVAMKMLEFAGQLMLEADGPEARAIIVTNGMKRAEVVGDTVGSVFEIMDVMPSTDPRRFQRKPVEKPVPQEPEKKEPRRRRSASSLQRPVEQDSP